MLTIWKDTYYTASTSILEYYITDGINTIFSGKAYAYPDTGIVKININRICQNHLNSELPYSVFSTNSGNITLSDAVKTFYLYDSNGSQLATYQFINDWSYSSSASTLSSPINGHYAPNMYCFNTTVSSNQVRVAYSRSGGNGYTIADCGDYALYYSNPRNGYDSFLIKGKVVEKKSITNFNYEKDIDNATLERSRIRYQSNIEPNWEINTGWLSDVESKKVYDNILSSNCIYFHNLNTGDIWPVSITDTQVTRKEFSNERKLISYTINIKGDNSRIRK